MGEELNTQVQKLGHIGGRTFLLTVGSLAAVAGLMAVLYLAWFTEHHFTRPFFIETSLVTPMNVVPDIQGSVGESSVTYGSANIESDEPLAGARMALAVSEGLYFLLFIAGCASVIMICRRLWKNQPFTALAHWMLLGLGMLAGIASLLAPWLVQLSTHLAVVELGFPGSGTEAVGPIDDAFWMVTSAEFSFQDANHPLLALGAVLILLSLVMRRGRRLYTDTEGLV